MSLNAIDINKIIGELSLILVNGRIEKIYQHNDDELIITIHKNENYHLYFNFSAGITRLHLISEKLKAQENPSSFIMLMRKYLKNSIVKEIIQLNEDRIVKITFETKTTTFFLVAELMDKQSNLFFLNNDEKIIGLLKSEKNIKKGDKFEIPQKPDFNINTLNLTCPLSDTKLYNEIIEEKYQTRTKQKETSSLNQVIISPMKKEMKKLKTLITNLEDDLNRTSNYDELIKKGQLLQAYFYKLEKGMDKIELEDFETNEKIMIALDKKLHPKDNVEAYFKKARKSKSAMKIIPQKIKATEEKYNKLNEIIETLLASIKNDSVKTTLEIIKVKYPIHYHKYLENIHKSIIEGAISILSSKKKHKKEIDPFRYYISATGKKIYVARSSRENDELTFGFAKGNDEWLHTRDYPGSHIIIPIAKNEEMDGKTLNEACQLALHFSKAKGNNSADVYYTKRKYLTKPKNASAGMVNLSKYKIINVILNETLLNSILERKNDE